MENESVVKSVEDHDSAGGISRWVWDEPLESWSQHYFFWKELRVTEIVQEKEQISPTSLEQPGIGKKEAEI